MPQLQSQLQRLFSTKDGPSIKRLLAELDSARLAMGDSAAESEKVDFATEKRDKKYELGREEE